MTTGIVRPNLREHGQKPRGTPGDLTQKPTVQHDISEIDLFNPIASETGIAGVAAGMGGGDEHREMFDWMAEFRVSGIIGHQFGHPLDHGGLTDRIWRVVAEVPVELVLGTRKVNPSARPVTVVYVVHCN